MRLRLRVITSRRHISDTVQYVQRDDVSLRRSKKLKYRQIYRSGTIRILIVILVWDSMKLIWFNWGSCDKCSATIWVDDKDHHYKIDDHIYVKNDRLFERVDSPYLSYRDRDTTITSSGRVPTWQIDKYNHDAVACDQSDMSWYPENDMQMRVALLSFCRKIRKWFDSQWCWITKGDFDVDVRE